MNAKANTFRIPESPLKGHITIGMMGLLLGLIPLFKDALTKNNCECTEIIFARVIITFLAASVFLAAKKMIRGNIGRFCPAKEHFWSFIGYGIICIAAVNFLYIKSLTYTSATVSVITLFTVVPITTIIANALFRKRKTSLHKIGFVCFIIVGCAIVNLGSEPIRQETHLTGIVLAMLAGMCYGLFSVFGKNLSPHYQPEVMIFWQFAIASLSTAIGLWAFNYSALPSFAAWKNPINGVLSIIGIGTVCTFIPYYLYAYGLKCGASAVTASALTLLEPVSTSILAVLFLGEAATWSKLIGVTMVLMSSYLLIAKKADIQVLKEPEKQFAA